MDCEPDYKCCCCIPIDGGVKFLALYYVIIAVLSPIDLVKRIDI